MIGEMEPKDLKLGKDPESKPSIKDFTVASIFLERFRKLIYVTPSGTTYVLRDVDAGIR